MFKKILYITIPLLSLLILSCEKDDYTGDSTLQPRNSTATLTFDTPVDIEDNDNSFSYTVTIDPPQLVDINIPVRALSEGTAVEGEDFTLDHTLIIPALNSTASGTFTIINDCDMDSGETVVIEIGNSSTANVSFSQTKYTVNLTNYESKSLDIFCTWNDTINLSRSYWNTIDTINLEQEFLLCDNVDIDMYLFDADGNNVYGYDGATASCIEHLVLQDLDNGTYTLTANLWTSAVPFDSLLMEKVVFPISVNFDQCGLFATTETQSEASAISNEDLDYYMMGSVFKPVAEITVMDGKYSWVMQ